MESAVQNGTKGPYCRKTSKKTSDHLSFLSQAWSDQARVLEVESCSCKQLKELIRRSKGLSMQQIMPQEREQMEVHWVMMLLWVVTLLLLYTTKIVDSGNTCHMCNTNTLIGATILFSSHYGLATMSPCKVATLLAEADRTCIAEWVPIVRKQSSRWQYMSCNKFIRLIQVLPVWNKWLVLSCGGLGLNGTLNRKYKRVGHVKSISPLHLRLLCCCGSGQLSHGPEYMLISWVPFKRPNVLGIEWSPL